MGEATKIQWTDATWNPVRGCNVVSDGCANCYAMGVAARFSDKGKPYEGLARFSDKRRLPQWTGEVRLVPEHLADPLRWTKPRRVFVNSMSDLFHEKLSNEQIAAVFGVMAAAPRHTFQCLTKRAKRMREWFEWMAHPSRGWLSPTSVAMFEAQKLLPDFKSHTPTNYEYPIPWPLPNVWLGVSAEDQQRADERIPDLLCTPAAVRFVSIEPQLGPIDLMTLTTDDDSFLDALDTDPESDRLDWVIVGGESGPRARPFDVAWARSVVEQCKSAGVACFVKQLGADLRWNGVSDPRTQRWPLDVAQIEDVGGEFRVRLKARRKGGDPAEWPADLRVREYPGTYKQDE